MQQLKRFLKKYSPDRKQLRNHKSIMIFGDILFDPRLWHFNRRPVAKAFAVGILCAWIPVPFHTLIAAGLAILFRCNLPVSAALVWLSNPLTMPLQFYIAYEVGAFVLKVPTQHFDIEFTVDGILSIIHHIWEPFLLGCLICGIICAYLANLTIRIVWRYCVIYNWENRAQLRNQKLKS